MLAVGRCWGLTVRGEEKMEGWMSMIASLYGRDDFYLC